MSMDSDAASKDLRGQMRQLQSHVDTLLFAQDAASSMANCQDRLPAPAQLNDALLAGQLAFEFISLVGDYVLGPEEYKNNKRSLASLEEIKTWSHDIDLCSDPEAPGRWKKIEETIKMHLADSTISRLQQQHMQFAHSQEITSMPLDQVEALLARLEFPKRVIEVFTGDLQKLRTLCSA